MTRTKKLSPIPSLPEWTILASGEADCFGYRTFYPFGIQSLKALEVGFLGQPLRLEAAHCVGAGGVPV